MDNETSGDAGGPTGFPQNPGKMRHRAEALFAAGCGPIATEASCLPEPNIGPIRASWTRGGRA